MTHLCHKPIGGGGRDSAVQQYAASIEFPGTGLAWEESICLRRREFIAGLGGAAAWPLAARAQQGDRVRRIGVLMVGDENDPVLKPYVSAFTQALAGLGWTDGRNLRLDLRYWR